MSSQTTRDPRRPQLERWGGGWSDDPRRGAVGYISGTRGRSCLFLLPRRGFRFGNAVGAFEGGLDVDVPADHLGGDAGIAQS
jgi:hypothetical protein